MKIKCPFCGQFASEKKFDYLYHNANPVTGESVVVKDAKCFHCESCHEEWFNKAQEDSIQDFVDRAMRKPLTPMEIKQIRESLPFKTKKEVADFLCLNSKAFVRWENGYTGPNMANDLLLRLVAYSEANFNFVKKLHETNFAFVPTHYFFVNEFLKKEEIVTMQVEFPKAEESTQAILAAEGYIARNDEEYGEEYYLDDKIAA